MEDSGTVNQSIGDGADLFILQLDRPLAHFLSLVHLSAQQLMETARRAKSHLFQSMFLAEHTMHLVILSNAAIDPEGGPSDEQLDESILLADLIRGLHKEMEQWSAVSSSDETVDWQEKINVQHDILSETTFSFRPGNLHRPGLQNLFDRMRQYDRAFNRGAQRRLVFEDVPAIKEKPRESIEVKGPRHAGTQRMPEIPAKNYQDMAEYDTLKARTGGIVEGYTERSHVPQNQGDDVTTLLADSLNKVQVTDTELEIDDEGSLSLSDILVGSTLPLHPRFGKNPRLSLQLIHGAKILKETRAVAGDENGIWEIDSPLNLPDTHQPLTLAVVVKTKDSKRRLVSATIRVPDLRVRVKTAPNEYYEFITCDSCASLQVILSCCITSTIVETLSHAVTDANRSLAHEEACGNEQRSVPQEPSIYSRKFLRHAYTKFAYLPNSDEKIHILSTVGRAYHALYQKSQDADDLDNAISIQKEAVNLGYFHPQQSQHLQYLSCALEARYDHDGNSADIDEAIQASQNALSLTQQDTPERIDILMQLASNYDSRFKHLGDVADIDVAVLNYSEAAASMPEEHPNKAVGHNNFASTLLLRFKFLGVLEDLERAISNLENAISLTPDGDPDKPSRYSNLGVALQYRFARLGDPSDLEMAISNQENAVRLTPGGHPDKPLYYNNLGNALQHRFKHLGDLNALEKAIINLESAVRLTPDGHPDKPSRYNILGNVLRHRFESLGDLNALEKAIINLESAVRLTPDGHPDKPSRYNILGNVLRHRFESLGDLNALEKAIINLESAVRLTPDGHPDKPSRYNILGNVLRHRFESLGAISDLEMAITNMENAVRLTPDGHPDKPLHCNNLGGALQLS